MINEQGVVDVLYEVMKDRSAKNYDRQTRLVDQGVDSLDFFNLVLLLQEKTGVEIPDEDVDKLENIADIVGYFNRT